MTPKQIALVQESFARLLPIADEAGVMFYKRLFEIDPELETLFDIDIEEQGEKLMGALHVIIDGLSDLDFVVTQMKDLGRRHAGYGVKDKDYDTVGQALLWTLAQGLGESFTEETKTAWAAAYDFVATTMKRAASEATAD